MKTSTERILTTHTGSLPRPAGLADRHDPDAVPGRGAGDGPVPAGGGRRYRQ